jgi:hypothetical protein
MKNIIMNIVQNGQLSKLSERQQISLPWNESPIRNSFTVISNVHCQVTFERVFKTKRIGKAGFLGHVIRKNRNELF